MNIGEQIKIRGDNTLELALVFQGLRAEEARLVWEPFFSFINREPTRFSMDIEFRDIPGNKMWHLDYLKQNFPGSIKTAETNSIKTDNFWWSGDDDQVSMYWYSYQSRYILRDLFLEPQVKEFASTLFAASRHWPLALHFNKGLADASAQAREACLSTAVNPAVYKAAALLILAAGARAFPGLPGHEPDRKEGEVQRMKVNNAMGIINKFSPGTGSYANEADYFESLWPTAFWGENYQNPLAIKHKYDPTQLFSCHHCVGSEQELNP